eukprot:4849530-Pleurochrysis_carterae.AAC.2
MKEGESVCRRVRLNVQSLRVREFACGGVRAIMHVEVSAARGPRTAGSCSSFRLVVHFRSGSGGGRRTGRRAAATSSEPTL